MKYIKKYENVNRLRIGSYVICQESSDYASGVENVNKLKKFISKNIGQYVKHLSNVDFPYAIHYDNVPDNIMHFFTTDEIKGKNIIWFSRYDILEYSENKEDLEIILNAKKYNL